MLLLTHVEPYIASLESKTFSASIYGGSYNSLDEIDTNLHLYILPLVKYAYILKLDNFLLTGRKYFLNIDLNQYLIISLFIILFFFT